MRFGLVILLLTTFVSPVSASEWPQWGGPNRDFTVEAADLAEAAVAHGPYRVVQRVWQAREPGELRALAQELMRRSGVVALLAGIGERTHLCFACAEGVDLDVASLLREACAQLEGKGGGQPHMAQGSAPPADVFRVETVFTDLLASLASHNR